jgi:hypothetical protein
MKVFMQDFLLYKREVKVVQKCCLVIYILVFTVYIIEV